MSSTSPLPAQPGTSPEPTEPLKLPASNWGTKTSQVVYENPWLSVREDIAIRPDGTECLYGVVTAKGTGALIVAFDTRDRICLVTVDRYPLAEVLVEVPGGGVDPGEDPVTAATRELKEECHLEPSTVELIGTMNVLGGLVCHRNAIVVARGCRPAAGEAETPEGDLLGHTFVDVRDVIKMMALGAITDAESVTALTRAMLHTGHLAAAMPTVSL
ncbi:NUDIX hydrolase [Paenarthrobacter sp. YJN-5]|uniref:NUDIX hydrolase n=1 Tax=Paenarthrobacter sp. YJN-5 TaxID=2735316 RepID=UPI0018789BE5|nr:NUDIX hydrolase [Paenarthrobacter sp. YJN-5]QOT19489.1 NUDIX hydrolase [Paenarthrobacter sp. YJN-5]